MHEFPEHEMLFRIPAIRFGKKVMRNPNKLLDRFPGADGMKTGFICASGFNVVASARRGDKRVIAVVFGAYSSWQRAEDAARLLERGFQPRFSLAALFSSDRRTVDAIPNIETAPADLRDVVCNRKRKRPAAESDSDDDDDENAEDPGATNIGAKGAKEKKNLLIDLPPSMAPVPVFVGATPPRPGTEVAEVRKKSKSKKARKKTEAKTGDANADAAAKPDDEKKQPAKKPSPEKKKSAQKKKNPEKKTE